MTANTTRSPLSKSWGSVLPTLTTHPLRVTVGVSLGALILTFINAWHVSMWVDEAATISVASRSLSDLWRVSNVIDAVHGVFYLLMHFWFDLVGISDVSVRLPSAIAVGIATAGVIVLARLLDSPKTAVTAGLIFAILPRVSGMGIEGRSYAATAAVAVWMTVLFVSLCRRPTTTKYVGYAILGAFAGSLNIFLVLLLGAHGLTLLASARYRFRRVFWTWLATAVAALLGAMPVLLTAVSQSAQIGPTRLSAFGYARSVLVNQWFLAETPTIFLSGGGSIAAGPGSQLWRPASVLLAVLCWAVIARGVLRAGSDEPQDGSISMRNLLLPWLLAPTVILVSYAVFATPIYNPRYLSFCTPALAILLGHGLVSLRTLPTRMRWLRWVAPVLVVALALPVYVSQRTVYAKSGADWSEVAEFVRARRAPEQGVYFAPRTPPKTEAVGLTSRTAQVLYPGAFAGVRDLTIVSTAAADANLVGRSQLLGASTDRLVGLTTVFVIQRRDYPVDQLAQDTELLEASGFRAADHWEGPLNVVSEFVR